MKRHWLGAPHAVLHTPIHRLSAEVKMGVALSLILITVLVPLSWKGWFWGALAGLVILAVVSQAPPLFLLKRILAVSPFVLGVALANAFEPSARGHWLGVAARSTLCLLTFILLAHTTPFSQMLGGLRKARVPGLLITTMALMYRYLFVLAEEAERMHRARSLHV